MEEKLIKETVKKMFSTGEIQIGVNVREVEGNQLRITVFVSDSEDEVLQSASVFVEN
jgi:hypothetical protein